MKKWYIVGAVVLIIGVYAAVSLFRRREISSSIAISAKPEEVWRVLRDRGNYSNWNSFIISSTGELKEGETIQNKMSLSGKGTMNFSPVVLKVDDNRELRWLGSMGVRGIFDGEHVFLLHPRDDGTTLLEQKEYFSGVLVPMLLPFIKSDTQQSFERMNNELRHEVEKSPSKVVE